MGKRKLPVSDTQMKHSEKKVGSAKTASPLAYPQGPQAPTGVRELPQILSRKARAKERKAKERESNY